MRLHQHRGLRDVASGTIPRSPVGGSGAVPSGGQAFYRGSPRPALDPCGRGRVCEPSAAILRGLGQGKSTLVAELLARGWGYLSDEIAPVDPVSGTAYPFPIAPYRRVKRQPNLPAAEVRRLPKVRVDVAQGAVRTAAVPLAGVYFLSYSPHTRAVELADSSPGTVVLDMLLHSLSSSESREMEIRGLSQLMTRVPTAYLRYANARDAAEQIAMVHEAMGPTSAELATQRILSAHSSEALDILRIIVTARRD